MERSNFRQSLKWARKEFVSKIILECDRDNKKLYKLASSLMGTTKENPLPECDSKEKLANQFAEFFIAKIQTIRDKLHNLLVYDHKDSSQPKLAKFEPLTEEEVRQIVKTMPSKCCDLDAVPTGLLKEAFGCATTNPGEVGQFIISRGCFCTTMENCPGETPTKKLVWT